jgi:hypothetical protein
MLDFLQDEISDVANFHILTSTLNLGDASVSHNNIEVCVNKYALEGNLERIWGSQTEFAGYSDGKPVYETTPNTQEIIAPDGSVFLLVHISVENVGDVISDDNTVLVTPNIIVHWKFTENEGKTPDYPYLKYKGNRIDLGDLMSTYGAKEYVNYAPVFEDYGARYPNVKEEGWLMFVVPANIDMSQTTITIQGLTWSFNNQSNV